VRRALALLLVLGLAPGTWFHTPAPHWNPEVTLKVTPLPRPDDAELAAHLGPFELDGIWSLTSSYSRFGSYSALVPMPGGYLLAFSDAGNWLSFRPPPAASPDPDGGDAVGDAQYSKFNRDIEAATRDPATGTIWTAREGMNAISRHDRQFRPVETIRPAALKDWGENSGPEAMVRLSDGRFVVIAEGFDGTFERRRHKAVLFPREPRPGEEGTSFHFAGAPGFSVTDMAQLPDGRVLVLMRRLIWPLPLRFAGRIMIADPAEIRPGEVWTGNEVARLPSTLPVDNFEGMAIEAPGDGRATIWLISDDNRAATQRTLLWKLAVDPVRLPRAREKGAEVSPRPSASPER
jgi:hypothetical protein